MLTLAPLRQRLATGVAVATLTLGVAGGLLGSAATPAQAEPIGHGEAATCWYDGKQYSEGAVIYVENQYGVKEKQTCQSDGTWKVGFRLPTPTRLPLAPLAPALQTR